MEGCNIFAKAVVCCHKISERILNRRKALGGVRLNMENMPRCKSCQKLKLCAGVWHR